MDALNNRIKELRKGKGLTQLQLSELLNVTDKAVSKWEVGEANPDITLLPKIAEIFEVTLDFLLTGKMEEDQISLDDMDTEKRLHYLIKKDDVINFTKYGYDQVSRSSALFTSSMRFGKYNFVLINLGLWKEILEENSKNILSLAFDKLLSVNNNNVCLAFLVDEILDELIKKAIDFDRPDILERLGVLFAKVGTKETRYEYKISIKNRSTFELPLVLKGDMDEIFRFIPCIINQTTLDYIFEHENESPNCYKYLTSIKMYNTQLSYNNRKEKVYIYNTLENDIIEYAIKHCKVDVIEKYGEAFANELEGLRKPELRSGIFYDLKDSYVKASGTIVARMYCWSKNAVDAVIKANRPDIAKKMMDHNRLYNKIHHDIWYKDAKNVYIITVDEIDRQTALLNGDLTDYEKFMLECIKDSCIVVSKLKSSRNLELVRKILDDYAYCPYEFIYNCLTKNKQQDLFKYFLDNDDEERAARLMLGPENYQNILLTSWDKYKCEEIIDAVLASQDIKVYRGFGPNETNEVIYQISEKFNLLEKNPMIDEIKKIKEEIYQAVVEEIAAEKKAKEEKIEREKIVKGLTKEYFDELLSSGANELFYIKLCSLLDAIFRFDYHYVGEDFSSRMNAHFRKLEANAPKSRDCDDGWGYMDLDIEYEKSVVIPEREKIEHLRDIFNRLRIQRNNIVHSEHQTVKELSTSEMRECLEYVFSIN